MEKNVLILILVLLLLLQVNTEQEMKKSQAEAIGIAVSLKENIKIATEHLHMKDSIIEDIKGHYWLDTVRID